MYSDGLLKLPIFTIQKNFKILLTVYSLSPHSRILLSWQYQKLHVTASFFLLAWQTLKTGRLTDQESPVHSLYLHLPDLRILTICIRIS